MDMWILWRAQVRLAIKRRRWDSNEEREQMSRILDWSNFDE